MKGGNKSMREKFILLTETIALLPIHPGVCVLSFSQRELLCAPNTAITL